MNEKFDDICANIRACLNSSKSQISLNDLNRDYKAVLGENIPYRSLGHSTLESFIRTVPNLKISCLGREIFVDVKLDEKTMHIANLVRGQKTAKKKLKRTSYDRYVRRAPPPPRRTYSPPKYKNYRSNGYKRSNGFDNISNGFDNRSKGFDNRSNGYDSRDVKKEHSLRHENKEPETYDDILRKYKSSQPSQLDFSDDEFDGGDFDIGDEINVEDEYDPDDYLKNDPPTSVSPNVDEIDAKVKKLQITLGNNIPRQVSMRHSETGTKFWEDDCGYSSMNEINTFFTDSSTDYSLNNATDTFFDSKKKTLETVKTLPEVRKGSSLTRSPAAFAAAGKAMKQPRLLENNNKNASVPGNSTSSINPSNPLREIDDLLYNPTFHKKKTSKYLNMEDIARTSDTPVSQKHDKTRGSKMCDLNMFQPAPAVIPDFSENTYCGRLRMFVLRHNLPEPVFILFQKLCPKKKSASFLSKIKIGTWLNFSSIPFESNNVKEVQEIVAQKAFMELKKRYENIDTSPIPVTNDNQLIISRVSEIISSHPTGLKNESIETKYRILYKETLPENWLDIIQNLSLCSVEKLISGIFVYPAQDENTNSSVSMLPPLILPEGNRWNIFITCCISSNCIYSRIIHENYNGLYESMAENMDLLYSEKKSNLRPNDVIKEGSFYAAFLGDHWFRVKALSGVDDDNIVRVSLIDHGDIDEISKNNIYPLDESLTKLSPQSVRFGLTDLERYCNEFYISTILNSLICDKALVASVDARNPHLLLTLFDTSTEKDINLNKFVLSKLENELSPPKIPSKNKVIDVYLVSFQEDGLAYVQLITEGFQFLKTLLIDANKELAKNQEEYALKSTTELIGKIAVFLAKYNVDNEWHRVVVNSVVSKNEVEVLFIDYGNIDTVKLENMASIHHFSEVLGIIPAQAVQVQTIRSTSDLYTRKVIEFLMDWSLYENGENRVRTFVMKVIGENVIPDVQLYTRTSTKQGLTELNDLIASYFPEYSNINQNPVEIVPEKPVKSEKTTRRKKVSLVMLEKLCPIKPFNVPESGQFLVIVSMAANPFNFIIQPAECAGQLEKMMEQMAEFYEKQKPVVDIGKIEKGQVYAVKTDNDIWCRGLIICIMQDLDCISVRLVDYGEISSIKYKNLMHLLPCFRELPAQAIKAQLAGVVPIHGDWHMNDILRFKDLVHGKTLISIIIEIKNDFVSLLLYDTTGKPEEEDIIMMLVEEGRAIDSTK